MTLAARWPHRVLGQQSTRAQARRLAESVANLVGSQPEAWLEAGRFEIKDVPGGDHGIEALCIPMSGNRFRFIIYGSSTDPNPERRAFLLCHEVAHTFFYFRSPGMTPLRAIPARVLDGGNEWEEDFCDEFAFAVTGLRELPTGLKRRRSTRSS